MLMLILIGGLLSILIVNLLNFLNRLYVGFGGFWGLLIDLSAVLNNGIVLQIAEFATIVVKSDY